MTEISIDFSPVLNRLSVVESRVSFVQDKVETVDHRVGALLVQQSATHQQLERLHTDFHAYVEEHNRRAELQLAETRILKIRQELENRFGHYDEVRRRVVGILQATDLAIVRQETMRVASEEVMLSTPRYWLAPALVALTAWICDRGEVCERSVAECLRRDASKTSLFFALVCHRASRSIAVLRWFERYLQLQDSSALDREVVLLLDAALNLVFDPETHSAFLAATARWIGDIEQQPGALEEHHQRWIVALEARTPQVAASEFELLRKYSPSWSALEASLARARRNGAVAAYFHAVLNARELATSGLREAVDRILDSLVRNFDDEELPLRKQEQLLQLVIEAEGDRGRAERMMTAAEETFVEKAPFGSRLTAAAMSPDQIGVSRSAQRFAIALSRRWIAAAHHSLVERDRSAVVRNVALAIDDWRGQTEDGTDATAQVASLEAFLNSKIEQALASVRLGLLAVIGWGLGVSGILGLFVPGCSGVSALLLALLGGGALFFAYNLREKQRGRRREELLRQRSEQIALLRACLKEVTAFRIAWTRADGEASSVETLLACATPESVLKAQSEAAGRAESMPRLTGESLAQEASGRIAVSSSGEASPIAAQVAAWDLVPPLVLVNAG